jgi:hypothetical protein
MLVLLIINFVRKKQVLMFMLQCQVYVEESWDEATIPTIKPSLTYSLLNLKVGNEIEATHVYTNNPSDFFIQLISSACKLDDVMSKIVTFCDGTVELTCATGQFNVEDSCIAQFSDDLVWYRAKVIYNILNLFQSLIKFLILVIN